MGWACFVSRGGGCLNVVFLLLYIGCGTFSLVEKRDFSRSMHVL
jgi:hypothetical protein